MSRFRFCARNRRRPTWRRSAAVGIVGLTGCIGGTNGLFLEGDDNRRTDSGVAELVHDSVFLSWHDVKDRWPAFTLEQWTVGPGTQPPPAPDAEDFVVFATHLGISCARIMDPPDCGGWKFALLLPVDLQRPESYAYDVDVPWGEMEATSDVGDNGGTASACQRARGALGGRLRVLNTSDVTVRFQLSASGTILGRRPNGEFTSWHCP